MTQDVYMGRALPRADVARSLDNLLADDESIDVDPHVDPTPDMPQASDSVMGRWPAVMVRHQGLEPRTR